MRSRRTFFATVAMLAACSIPTCLSAQGVQLSQTVSPWLKKAQLIGPAEDSKRVSIAAYLSWRNSAGQGPLLKDQNTPGNAHYGQFLSPEQFHAAFSPRAQDVSLVQSTLRGLGFKVEYTPDSGLFVRASGTVAQIKHAFGVTQNLYSYRGKTLRAHAEEPTLPVALKGLITYIGGLDDSRLLMRPTHLTRSQGPIRVNSGTVQPPFGSPIPSPCSHYWDDTRARLESSTPFPYAEHLPWLPCGYTPQQIREAYRINRASETGRGVRIAIVDLYASPTLEADVNRFSANHGLPPLTQENFRELLPAGVNEVPPGDPCASTGWFSEQTLDVTAVHTVAPGAFILYVGGVCDAADEPDAGVAVEPLYEVIDHRLADIVSNSWLYNGEEDVAPGQLQSDNAELIQAALQGMSVVFAAGDDGDLTQASGFVGGRTIASGSWPATSPYVTALGGTSLLLKNDAGKKSEYGWATYVTLFQNPVINAKGDVVTEQGYVTPFLWAGGTGGGPSLVMPQPFYQKGVVPDIYATQTVSATGQIIPLDPPARVTPDISMLADFEEGLLVGESYAISSPPADAGCTPLSATMEYCEQPFGGTSLATPLFAGVLALVNEARFGDGNWPIGFANPALYRLRVGDEKSDDAPIIDVNAPDHPIGGLAGFLGIDNFVLFAGIDSNLDRNGNVIENVDSSLHSAKGYDDVTGLGAPNVPALIWALR